MAKRKAKSRDELEGILRKAVTAAVDFMQSEIAPKRAKAIRYFNGEVDIGHEEGRSKVVATKVRDTIRAMKPGLMRVFLSNEKPVEFKPTGPDDVTNAETATRYCAIKLAQAGGYGLLRDVFHDAMVAKVGILKAYWEAYDDTQIHTYSNLTQDEVALLLQEPGVEVLGFSEYPEMGTADLRISRTVTKGKLCIDPVAPESFFIDGTATGLRPGQYLVCGHRTDVRYIDALGMGFEEKDLDGLGSFETGEAEEEEERRGYIPRNGEDEVDPDSKLITITEAYMRVDADGTGKPVLHRFMLGGTSYRLLSYEVADELPFAAFQIDPIPHTFHGNSIADLIENEQDAGTSILRGVLDNVSMVNTPRTAALEGAVNIEDLLNNEIGGVVRVRNLDAVRPLDVPFVAGQTLAALQYLDQSVEEKTGVTRASTGLDPDALQSTTRAAVNATVAAAAGQVEVVARNLAESGLIPLFKLILRIMARHAPREELVRINGEFTAVDPRVWDIEMDMEPNVGLGTGREEEKAMALDGLLARQEQAIAAYGLGNGFIGLSHYRNALADRLAIAGLRNADRYMAVLTPDVEQAIMEQAQGAAQQGDPSQAIVQAEVAKAQIKQQTDMAKIQQDGQVQAHRLQQEALRQAQQDDLARDRMAQDLAVKTGEMAMKYGVQMNTAAIKAEQAAPRGPDGSVQRSSQ